MSPPISPRRPRPRPALRALALAGGVAAALAAADLARAAPPFYTVPVAGAQGKGGGWSLDQVDPATWRLQAPELRPAPLGGGGRFVWRCQTSGSQIERVDFAIIRTQAPSSFEFSVHAGGHGKVWAIGDVSVLQTPTPTPSSFSVPTPGTCEVSLEGTQVEQRNQHARAYFIAPGAATVRDLTAPDVVLRGIDGIPASGWIPAGVNGIGVRWGAYDNFGASGIGTQHVIVAGIGKWAGAPGQGEHGVGVDLGGVGDGDHQVIVRADGGGTAGAQAQATLRVDRTAPRAGLTTALASDARSATARITAADATSGVAGWTLRRSGPVGPVVATHESDPDGVVEGLDLGGFGSSPWVWHLAVRDVAGNLAQAQSEPLSPPPSPAGRDALGTLRLDPAAAGVAVTGQALSDLSAARLMQLRVAKRPRVIRRGRERLLHAVPRYGRTVRIAGRIGREAPGRPGIAGLRVLLRAPGGRIVAETTTDAAGRFAVAFAATKPGIWQAIAVGDPAIVARIAVTTAPRLVLTRRPAAVPERGLIAVKGRMSPRRLARGRLVALEYRTARGWRPFATARAGAGGRFALRYRLTRPGGYGLVLRVRAPRDRGVGVWGAASRPFTVRVGR